MQQSDGVKQALQRFYDVFTANDPQRFEAEVLSREADAMAIGTAPHEWIDTRERCLQEFGMEGVTLRGEDARAWEEGSVGWFVDRPVFTLPDGGQIGCRLTGVMRQEDGDWKLVQAHFSVGIADEEAAEATSPEFAATD